MNNLGDHIDMRTTKQKAQAYAKIAEATAATSVTGQEKTGTDRQEGGEHYQMPIQPIEFIHANEIPYMEGNVIKYVCRHKRKNKAEDIKKAIHYLELILELEYGRDKFLDELVKISQENGLYENTLGNPLVSTD